MSSTISGTGAEGGELVRASAGAREVLHHAVRGEQVRRDDTLVRREVGQVSVGRGEGGARHALAQFADPGR